MKNIPTIKIGLIVGSTDWMPEKLAVERRTKVIESYMELFGDDVVYECPICVTDNEVSVKRALKDIEKAECTALCLYYANYGPESAGTLLISEFNGPVMMVAASERGADSFMHDRTDALSGFINACYALGLRNDKVHIPSNPVLTYEQCAEELRRFIPVARTYIALRNLKLITIGPRPSSYLASCVPVHPLYDLGIDFSEYSELELLDSYKKHEGDRRIASIVESMRTELGDKGNKFPDSLARMAQYEVTLDDWIRNHKGNRKYITMTSTCWPAFPLNFGFVPCYVNSRMTGKGIPVACEVDTFGAVSEYIGQCISDKTVTILNINNNISKEFYEENIEGKVFAGKQYKQSDLFMGYHCGVTPSELLESPRSEPHFVNDALIGTDLSLGTIHGRLKASEVTIFRLQSNRDGQLQAYVVKGAILPISLNTYGGYAIIAVSEMGRFLRNVVIQEHFPNHAVIIQGDCAVELVSLLRLLGVNRVHYNHPAGVPYESENVFETSV